MARVLVIGAHDDDPVIGVGGILQKMHAEDDITLLICTDGQGSHVHVLGITENPSPLEVAAVRQAELDVSCDILGTQLTDLIYEQLDFENGDLQNHISELSDEIREFLEAYPHDMVYVHALDAHPEHRAVHEATLNALRDLGFKGEVNAYSIWTRELAEGRTEVDASQIQELTGESLRVNVHDFLPIKREALFAFTSQVQVWPYAIWQPQAKPILEKAFIDYFLRGEEIITPIHL